MKARVPNFAKVNGNINNSNSKVNGTLNESKKISFFGKKDSSKSKEKEKEKEKEKDVKDTKEVKDRESTSPKQRPSVAHMPHPASFSTLYQLHQMQNGVLNGTVKHNGNIHRHNSQPEPYIWHAKSYESGIGN